MRTWCPVLLNENKYLNQERLNMIQHDRLAIRWTGNVMKVVLEIQKKIIHCQNIAEREVRFRQTFSGRVCNNF